MLSNSFFEARSTLINKKYREREKEITRKENYTSIIFTEHRFKNSKQILAQRIKKHIKRIVYHNLA